MKNNNILLLGARTLFDIENYPRQAKKIIPENFDVYYFNDNKLSDLKNVEIKFYKKDNYKNINELNGCILRDRSKDIFVNDINKSCYLTHSLIFDNVYYPIDKFEENYKYDFRNTFLRILSKLGAGKVLLAYDNETEYKEYKKNKKSAKYNGPIDIDVSMDKSDGFSSYKKNIDKTNIKFKKRAVSREEFESWIKSEKINLKVFNKLYLEAFIDNFFDNGKLDGAELYRDILEIESIEEAHENCKKIGLGLKKLPKNLSYINQNFEFDFKTYKKLKKKITKKMILSVEF